jgi:peptidase MA superfamily protein
VGAVKSRTRPVGASLIALLASILVGIPAVAAAEPTFGPASATATFGESIVVEQSATLPEDPRLVEAVVRSGIDAPTFRAAIANPGAGATTLRYRFDTPFGGLYPNTSVEMGFRITFADGSVVDGPTTTVRYEDTRFDWRTLEGSLVRVHWFKGNDAFGQRILEIGERGVENAAEAFGVSESEPIDFFVYGDQAAFEDVLGPAQRENVGGIALPEIRTMFAGITPDQVNEGWIQLVVPHELTHLVFDTATRNPYHAPPHWLNEGLADYMAVGYTAGARANVESAVRRGAIMPLRALVGRFPTTADRFGLAYDESTSAVDYLVRTHGQEKLVGLLRSYAGGVSDAQAFSTALGVDDAAFEAGWFQDLGFDEPAAFGPLPAPPGPVPPGWAAAPAATPRPGQSGPVATPRTPGTGDGDATGTVILGGLVVLVVLLIVGLVVVARRLSHGDPLLPPLTAPPDDPDDDDPVTLDDPTLGAREEPLEPDR